MQQTGSIHYHWKCSQCNTYYEDANMWDLLRAAEQRQSQEPNAEFEHQLEEYHAMVTFLEELGLWEQSTTRSWAARTVRNTLPFKSGTKHQSAKKIADNYAGRNWREHYF